MARPRRARFHEADATDKLVDTVRSMALPLSDSTDLDPIMHYIGDARFVLLGEASHGTADYYNWRSRISQRLIREKQFSFIAVEGDWPDCYRVNRYVQHMPSAASSAREALKVFQRWPTWMWANEEVAAFLHWLRDHNTNLPADQKVGFYGLDVYSLWDSMHIILKYLERTDGAAAAAARRAFACFEPYEYDVNQYARAVAWVAASCENAVVEMLARIRAAAPTGDPDDREAHFNAEQNALVAAHAEMYYRTMVRGDSASWNVRDRHMVETLNRLMKHRGPDSKAIVWAHNTHVGDARFTDMAADGMVNVGQLVREQHEEEGVVLVGFSSHRGTVIAGDEWGAPMRVVKVPHARPGSWEEVLHGTAANHLLIFDDPRQTHLLQEPRGHRAIGVVYRPQYEAFGNYVPTVMPRRYDALLYIDESRALHPLHVPSSFEHEVPETFPTGV